MAILLFKYKLTMKLHHVLRDADLKRYSILIFSVRGVSFPARIELILPLAFSPVRLFSKYKVVCVSGLKNNNNA